MYDLSTAELDLLKRAIGKELVIFNSITSKKIIRGELERGWIAEEKTFAFGALYVQLSFGKGVGTLLFTPRASHLSVLVEHVEGIGTRGPFDASGFEWSDDFITIPCDDAISSERYFAAFLGTTIVSVEIIHVHETGRRGRRANERGVHFTNAAGRQFTIGYHIGTPETRGGMDILKPEEINPDLLPRMTFTKLL